MGDTGFIYAIICAIAQGMCMIVIGVCLERLLTGRDDRISRRKRLILWTVLSFVTVGIKCLVLVPSAYFAFGNAVFQSLCYIFFLKYCYSDKTWIKLTHVGMLIIQNVLADAIHEVVWGKEDVEIWQHPFLSRNMAEICTIIAAISILLNIGYTVIVLRMRKKKRMKISAVWVVIMLLIFLIFASMRLMQDTQGLGRSENSYFVFMCVATVLEFSTLMLYLSQSEKQEEQEEVRKLQQVMELEKVHYEQIEARREEMAKIRHDYNNVITSVMFLIENGKMEEAGDVIKDLSERISKTREYPFCGVPIINAVLTEKQKECSITLSGGMAQNYLIVKCRNASLENREKKIKGTGYGHKILEDIARKYDGDFQTSYEDGVFMTQISLGVK